MRIKIKCLCDRNERGGLQLPNLKLYHEAVALSWIQEWLTLSNDQILNLEGHNMIFGWHAYLYYQKYKNDKFFSQHIIRNSLHKTWQKYFKYIGDKRPQWLVPIEIIKLHLDYKIENGLTNKDLIDWRDKEPKLKDEQELSIKLG